MSALFTLLTHRKEFGKRSNTGRLVVDVLGDRAEQVCWERTQPPQRLIEQIARGGVALVYPGGGDSEGQDFSEITQFVVIDGTWITARKIHQRSPYLHLLRRVSFVPAAPSQYNLRKNQKESGLCTAETVVEVLRVAGRHAEAEELYRRFLAYIKPAPAAQSRGEPSGDLRVRAELNGPDLPDLADLCRSTAPRQR